MIKTIGFGEFCDSFSDTYKDNFSYNGKRALFDYLENCEEETGEDIELDIVALCCDYAEYRDLEEIREMYLPSFYIKDIEDLQDRTVVIEFDSGIIIQQF